MFYPFLFKAARDETGESPGNGFLWLLGFTVPGQLSYSYSPALSIFGHRFMCTNMIFDFRALELDNKDIEPFQI